MKKRSDALASARAPVAGELAGFSRRVHRASGMNPAWRSEDAAPGFSGVMSRVCEMVWPVWPDTASSEHGADLAGAARAALGSGACGTAVSRHPVLQRTPVAPVDQRRADSAPI